MAAPVTPKKFGLPWPEFNDGVSYDDVVRPSDAGSHLSLSATSSLNENT